jgi:hypothetical protein
VFCAISVLDQASLNKPVMKGSFCSLVLDTGYPFEAPAAFATEALPFRVNEILDGSQSSFERDGGNKDATTILRIEFKPSSLARFFAYGIKPEKLGLSVRHARVGKLGPYYGHQQERR